MTLNTDPNNPNAERNAEEDLPPETGNVGIQVEEYTAAAKDDLSLFAGIMLPNEVKFAFPAFFQFLWITVTRILFKIRDFSKYAIALPRGHGKTMVVKYLIVFVVLYTKRRFIAVICAKQDLAENILRDVVNILNSDNVRKLYGDWDLKITKNNGDTKIFYYRGRQIILKAEGAGTSFRGVNIDNARPDVMIFDDAQTKDCAKSETQALDYINWFQGTALKAKDPTKCTYLYVGNMYPNLILREDPITGKKLYGCHLRNLKENPAWKTIITGGILADGTALWEELQPYEQLMEEFEGDLSVGMPEIFYAEVMNDPDAQINADFDFEKVPYNPYSSDDGTDLFDPDGKYLVIDPSLGTEKSDKQAVGEFWLYDGKPVFRKILPTELTQVDAPTLVFNLIKYCLDHGISLIVAEDYAYQKTLLQWFDYVMRSVKVEGIELAGMNRGMKSKNAGIIEFMKACQVIKTTEASIFLHPDIRSELYAKIRVWDKTQTKNKDDLLDVGYYGYRAASNSELMEKAMRVVGAIQSDVGELVEPSGSYTR
jgi:hypothetical protein